jgi:hypothetical protein
VPGLLSQDVNREFPHTDESPGWSETRTLHWTGAFFLNLILLLPLGLVATARGGMVGLLFGLTAVWAGGYALCGRSPRVGGVMIWGGTALAAFQVAPVLHVGSWLAALATWHHIFPKSGTGGDKVDAAASAFGITLLTAMPLLFAAFVFGGGHRLILGTSADGAEPAGDPDDG